MVKGYDISLLFNFSVRLCSNMVQFGNVHKVGKKSIALIFQSQ